MSRTGGRLVVRHEWGVLSRAFATFSQLTIVRGTKFHGLQFKAELVIDLTRFAD